MRAEVEAMFHDLADLSPAARAQYFIDHGVDEETRREVEALLMYDSRSSSDLQRDIRVAAGLAVSQLEGKGGRGVHLLTGEHLNHYLIESQLGAGGMGEVYQARDTRLGRRVAVKVLPEVFARDSDRISRFEREAKLLASLNHPHIAALYAMEQAEGKHFLVMELVEGETLAAALQRGPLPVEEALKVAQQIADAVEAAHAKGVIHRDLKAANVKITLEGTIKVLDFGVAKVVENTSSDADISNTPPRTIAPTQEGVIWGTPAYMSPEQMRGKAVDKQTDIWAFGCLLYELLTGKHAFQGETLTDTIAVVLEYEPDWQALPPTTPRAVRELLRRCLQKDKARRLRDIGDAQIEIEDALAAAKSYTIPPEPIAAASGSVARSGVRPRRIMLAVLAGALVAIIAGFAVWNPRPLPAPAPLAVSRFTIALAPGQQFGDLQFPQVAISPRGTELAYVARSGNSAPQIFIRALDSLEARPLLGTEGAYEPFFSPDGQWIGFFAQGKLRKVSVDGGFSQSLCDASFGEGASWGPDDTIYFAPTNVSGLWKVSASGGKSQEVTKLDRSKGEISHRFPQVLPGGKAVLFTSWTGPGWEERHLAMLLLATGERRVVVSGGETGRYVSTGHLVYNRAGMLVAVPFDLTRLQTSSPPPIPLGEAVKVAEAADYSLSSSGSLVYLPDSPQQLERRLVWVDRKGRIEPLPAPPRPYLTPKLSPDGRRVAVGIRAAIEGLWVYDLSRGTLTRLTTPEASSQAPTWSPDGKHIAYRGTRAGFRNVYWITAEGGGMEERLTTGEYVQTPSSWSPYGKWLAFTEAGTATGRDIEMLPLEGDPPQEGTEARKPRVFLRTPANEDDGVFSPDGHWLAYESNESGRFEIYVQPFPGPARKFQISTQGGIEPVWARNGRELFYRSGNKMMAVEINRRRDSDSAVPSGFWAGSPQLLFEGNYEYSPYATSGYDVSPDGQRFLMVQSSGSEQGTTQIQVVLNWLEELKRKVPAK